MVMAMLTVNAVEVAAVKGFLVEDAPRRIRRAARRVVRRNATMAMTRIKERMPVDTGRARAGWGRWRRSDLVTNPQRRRGPARSRTFWRAWYARRARANQADAIWIDNGLSITQGTNVGYVAQLNAGSSRKAPAGFIDVEIMYQKDDFPRRLSEALAEEGVAL